MSYEKHTWETGETITAEKLNNLEDGVASDGGSNSLIVNFVDGAASERYVADKTRSEILEALNNGQVIIAIYNTSDVNFRGLIYQAMGEFTVQFNSIWGFYSRDGQMQSQYEWWKKA